MIKAMHIDEIIVFLILLLLIFNPKCKNSSIHLIIQNSVAISLLLILAELLEDASGDGIEFCN